MKEKILITGIGGPAGKSAVTYFRGKGYPVIGTDIQDVEVKADTFLKVPVATDPAFTQAILDIISKFRPALFIPTVTEELVIVARLKEKIKGLQCEMFISTPDAVEIANDKLKTAIFMKDKGIPVPVTFDSTTPRDLILKTLGLPLLAKPCFGRGGRGVVLYRTPAEFYSEQRKDIIFQEFIPGEEFDVNIFMEKSKVLSAKALKKTVLKDGIIGNALEVQRVENKDVIDLSKKAAGLLGMEGPLDFDIRFRKDGTPVLLEINARVGGNVLYAREVLDSLIISWEKRRKENACI